MTSVTGHARYWAERDPDGQLRIVARTTGHELRLPISDREARHLHDDLERHLHGRHQPQQPREAA